MGRLFVVGIGPGRPDGMTGQARFALERSDLICGYTRYVEMVQPLFPDKSFLSTGMCSEVERCRAALAEASGKTVSIVSSGDPGVYGMAGLVLELSEGYPDVEIEVVPGVTAAQSGAALLGAPLMQDYAVISLSDLLVPWEKIERRLRAAGEGDFSIVLYNPASSKRADRLERACDILLETRSGETVCGVVRNAGREDSESAVLTLSELRGRKVDMFTTVFVGSSETRIIGGRMVTPRGYGDRL